MIVVRDVERLEVVVTRRCPAKIAQIRCRWVRKETSVRFEVSRKILATATELPSADLYESI